MFPNWRSNKNVPGKRMSVLSRILLSTTIGAGAALFVVVFVYGLMLSGAIQIPSWTPKSASIFAQIIAHPPDCCDYLVNEEYDISKKGFTRTFTFKNKYAGRHAIGLLLEGHTYDMDCAPHHGLPPTKLKLKFDFYSGKSLILSKQCETSEIYYRDAFFFSIGDEPNGLWLNSYECPDELPIDEPITCQVTVVDPDPALQATPGPTRFFIQRWCDDPPYL
jgi:hypothetical protein